jgi:hypothetical protein
MHLSMSSVAKLYDVVEGNRRYHSGYCYLHWFDELALYNGFSGDDDKINILVDYLGEFPRIKVVLSVLYMLCVDKSLVFSFPSFNPYKRVYHLSRASSRKFSVVVLMEYFMSDNINKLGSDEGMLASEIVSILDLDDKMCTFKKFLLFMTQYECAFPLNMKNCVKFVSVSSVIELD